jgi:transketolase
MTDSTIRDTTMAGSRGNSWQIMDLVGQAPGFAALSQALVELTDEGVPVVVGTADLKYSNGLVRYQQKHPDRFIQFGISEQNMVSAAAGIATTGNQPWVATFASFLALLCAEQIRTDTAYTRLPVRMVGHHAGITLGFYGTSHHATEDLAIMRSIANLTVLAPADPAQLHALVKQTRDINGPVYIRIGRGRDPQVYDAADLNGLRIGRAMRHGPDAPVTVVATGSMVHPSLEAQAALAEEGIDVCVLDMHTVKPFDREAIERAASVSELIVSVEEHNILGGLGGAVAEVMAESASAARLIRHGIRDEYSLVGPPSHLYRHYGLDAEGIAHVVRSAEVQPVRSGA